MIKEDWLICGTRKGNYSNLVIETLDKLRWNNRALYKDWKPKSIIEGCCPGSADIWAEEWAKKNEVEIQHHPSTSGNYLKRNIEMVGKSSLVIAFWDGKSRGTAHMIQYMRAIGKHVYVVRY